MRGLESMIKLSVNTRVIFSPKKAARPVKVSGLVDPIPKALIVLRYIGTILVHRFCQVNMILSASSLNALPENTWSGVIVDTVNVCDEEAGPGFLERQICLNLETALDSLANLEVKLRPVWIINYHD